MSNAQLIQRGLELTTQAANADSQGDYPKALKLYTLGVEAFLGVLRSKMCSLILVSMLRI
jgi:hypothetical protein